jgi:uncharacterized protein YjiS (DUF1127 family)
MRARYATGLRSSRPRPARRFAQTMALAAAGWGWLRAATQRSAQRRALARLDDRLLRDVGLTRAAFEAEVGKPFWRD